MGETVPECNGAVYSKVTITPGRNLPWLTKDLQQAFRTRNLAYKRAKRTGCPDHFDQYKLLRNKATSMLCTAKRNHRIARPFGKLQN